MKHVVHGRASIGSEFVHDLFSNYHAEYHKALPNITAKRAAALAIAAGERLPRQSFFSQNVLAMYWGADEADEHALGQSLYGLKRKADWHTEEMIVSVGEGRLQTLQAARGSNFEPLKIKVGRIAPDYNEEHERVSSMGGAFMKSKADGLPVRGIAHPRLSMSAGIMVSDGLTIRLGHHGIVQKQPSKTDPSLLTVFEGSVPLRDDPERFDELAVFEERDTRIGNLGSYRLLQTIATYIGPRMQAKFEVLPEPSADFSASAFVQSLAQIIPRQVEAVRT